MLGGQGTEQINLEPVNEQQKRAKQKQSKDVELEVRCVSMIIGREKKNREEKREPQVH